MTQTEFERRLAVSAKSCGVALNKESKSYATVFNFVTTPTEPAMRLQCFRDGSHGVHVFDATQKRVAEATCATGQPLDVALRVVVGMLMVLQQLKTQ